MIQIGCTGHQRLSDSTRPKVAAAIGQLLAEEGRGEFGGLTSLAEGADQLFAFCVLAAGGSLHAVVPSDSYERSFESGGSKATYQALLGLAAEQTRMPFREPSEDAFLAAGHEVVDRADILVAVWDGEAAAGKGGTADVVAYARARGVDVRVIWPAGATRR